MERGADCSEAERLGAEIRDRAAALHAATAELVSLVGQLDAIDGWQGSGIRSVAHWLSIEAGFELTSGSRLAGLAESLRSLPLVAAEFAAGRLSADKARLVAKGATRVVQGVWLGTAPKPPANR